MKKQALDYLLKQTQTEKEDWEELDGPDSGVGTEFWFKNIHTSDEAYICIDQGEIVGFSIN